MAATLSTMAMLNAKCMTKSFKPTLPTKPISLLPATTTTTTPPPQTSAMFSTAIAGAVFSTLSSCDPAFAAQQIAEIAEGDNRGIALLLPLIPAIAWVLYNIFQPALNQINRMRSNGLIIGVGLGGLATSGFLATPDKAAAIAEAAASSDNRGQLLLFVVTPAILWVLYNILQPALNQINRMRS